jgi:hypothetical protein
MTVSGLGSSHTPFPTVTSHPAAATHARPAKADKPQNDFEQLTAADRDLIYEATGQRIGPGFDPARETTSAFAAGIAAGRASGQLAPGQEVTAVYLKDLNRRYERAGGPNPIAPHLDKAVAYLSRAGRRRIDVTA